MEFIPYNLKVQFWLLKGDRLLNRI